MSKINTLRIVNLNYNNNSIKISDETFQFNGENTLMSLRNGGGKTVLVQMMTAPFVHKRYRDTKDRPFESYFTTNRPTFIMVEWVLDGGAGYVLTGMMVRKNQEVADGEVRDELEILNFISEYKERCENDIYHIPIIEETSSGLKLKNWGTCKRLFEELKRDNGFRFNYFDMNQPAQSRNYFDKLKEYNINYKEWENIIKKVNLKESGLSELFSDCRDEKSLVEKWFLEAVEGKLNKETNRIDEFVSIMIKYIKQYRENNTKISRIKTIKEFREESLNLKYQTEEYQNAANECKINEEKIAFLYNSLLKLLESAEVEEKNIESELEALQKKAEQIKYEEISYEIHKKEDEKDFYIHDSEQLEKEKAAFENNIKRLRRQKAVLSATKINEQMMEALSEYKICESRIEVSRKAEEEKEPERRSIGSRLYIYYNNQLKESEEREFDIKNKISELEQEISIVNNTRIEIQNKINSDTLKLGKISAMLTSYDGIEENFNEKYHENIVRNILGEYEDHVLDKINEKYDEQISGSQKRLSDCKKEKQSIEEDVLQNDKNRESVKISIIEDLHNLEAAKSKYDTYNAQIEMRKTIMQHFSVSGEMLYEDEKIMDAANRKLSEIESVKHALEKDYDRIEHEYKKLQDGHVMELDSEFSDYLDESDIQYVYGMDWLQNNGAKVSENYELIDNNPFIPYSIIVSSEDFYKLSENEEGVYTSFPVPVIKREELEEKVKYGKSGIVSLDGVNFYMMFKKEILDEDRRTELIENYKTLLDKKKKLIEIRKNEYEEYLSKKNVIKNQNVSEKLVQDISRKIEKYSKNISDNELKLEELAEENNKLKEKLVTIDKIINDEKENDNRLHMKLSDFKMLCRAYTDYLNNNKEKEEITAGIGKMQSELNEISSRLETISSDIKSYERKIMSVMTESKEFSRKAEQYTEFANEQDESHDIKDVTPEKAIDMESHYKALSSGISEEITLLSEQLSGAKSRYNRCKSDLDEILSKYGLNVSDIEGITYSKDELISVEEKLAANEEKAAEYNGRIQKSETEIRVVEDRIRYLYIELNNSYHRNSPVDKKLITETDFKNRIKVVEKENSKLYSAVKNIRQKAADYKSHITAMSEFAEFKQSEDREFDIDFATMTIAGLGEYKAKLINDYKKSISLKASEQYKVRQALNSLARKESFKDEFFMKPIEILLSLTDNADSLMKQLEIINYSYDSMVEKLETDVAIIEKEGARIVSILKDYVKEIHDNLNNIDKNSTIDIRNRKVRMLEIKLPDWKENEELYCVKLKDMIDEITNKGIAVLEDNGNIEEMVGMYLNTRNLYDTVVGNGNVAIYLYKIEEQKEQRITWSDVAKNSGGEGFLSSFIILSSLLYYMRKEEGDIFADKNEGKVLVMDNPFAQTNASHLLKPLIDMAKKTNTQLICLSGLGGDSIYNRFDNIYVLSLVTASLRGDMQYLTGEHTRGREQETMISSRIYVEQQELIF